MNWQRMWDEAYVRDDLKIDGVWNVEMHGLLSPAFFWMRGDQKWIAGGRGFNFLKGITWGLFYIIKSADKWSLVYEDGTIVDDIKWNERLQCWIGRFKYLIVKRHRFVCGFTMKRAVS